MRPVTPAEIERLLRFPRAYIRTRLPSLHTCPHATNYDALDPTCAQCSHRHDCSWLSENDELGSLDLGSPAQVQRVLEEMCAQAQSAVTVLRHRGCACATCRFLRQGRAMLERLRRAGISGRSQHPAAPSP